MKMKPVKSFRIDPVLLEKAKEEHLEVVKIFEDALRDTLKRKTKCCPHCGNNLGIGDEF